VIARAARLLALWGPAALFAAAAGEAAAGAPPQRVVLRAGAVEARVQADPWRIVVAGRTGATRLTATRMHFRAAGGALHRTTRALSLRARGRAVVARVATSAPGVTVGVRIDAVGDGVVGIDAAVPGQIGASAVGAEFAAAARERFFGFGERSDEVGRRSGEVESYVADGPFRPEDRAIARAAIPPWATRDRRDATYFPIPWLLSSRGWGVLVDQDDTSRFALPPRAGTVWRVEADAPRLALEVFAGPTPAAALARFTARTGRQPPPPAPWTYGPWVQTGQPNVIPPDEERAIFRTLRAADAPVSVAETQMHYLPCGAQRGRERAERARTDALHGLGVARLIYFNPSLCTSYTELFGRAAASRALQRDRAGTILTHTAFVGGGGAAGFTLEPLAQFDFTARTTARLYHALLREAVVEHGADGWMEDFGEGTPPEARFADGTTGDAAHNRYPRDYHCAIRRLARTLPRPVVRFQRSGWTGTARCADNVWGGDPTTVWGFDGLSSAVIQALSAGMSGISRWGSDIGGYNSFGGAERLTPELLTRWIELGGVSGVMRTKRSGIAIPAYERPQVYDRAHLPVWRRYAKLRTQLLPYLRAADAEHRRTGLPLMRHLALVHPGDTRAVAQDTQFLLGDDLLAAPVTAPGVRRRAVYAPAGDWLHFWTSVRFHPRTGAFLPWRPRLLRGRRVHVLPAPLGQVPLLLRAGAVLPLLPADVDTLAPYPARPGRGVVRLADRRDRLVLLAFPRGDSVSRADGDVRLRSRERARRWTLAISARRARRFTIHAAFGTLHRPFAPRAVLRDGRRVPFAYDRRSRVLRVALRTRRATLEVSG
jgi:alpha-glucosidase (family GH31 glycosyl hydrolase)